MKKIFITVFLSLTLITAGCSNKPQNTQTTPPKVTTEKKPNPTSQITTQNKNNSVTKKYLPWMN